MPERAGKTQGWVYLYFVRAGDYVKIGRAINVLNRVRALQVSHSENIRLLAAIPVHASIEPMVHRHFKHLRKTGEWFRLGPDLVEFINRSKWGEPIVALLNRQFLQEIDPTDTHAGSDV